MAQARTKHADPPMGRKKRAKDLLRKGTKAKTKRAKLKKKIEKVLAVKTVKTPREPEAVSMPEPSIASDLDRARLARIRTLAEKVFGDQDKARRWFGQPKRALGGKAPLSYMTDDNGEQIIEKILYQIDYGMFS